MLFCASIILVRCAYGQNLILYSRSVPFSRGGNSEPVSQRIHTVDTLKETKLETRHLPDNKNSQTSLRNQTGPEIMKKNMLNSAEHKIFPAHKC